MWQSIYWTAPWVSGVRDAVLVDIPGAVEFVNIWSPFNLCTNSLGSVRLFVRSIIQVVAVFGLHVRPSIINPTVFCVFSKSGYFLAIIL